MYWGFLLFFLACLIRIRVRLRADLSKQPTFAVTVRIGPFKMAFHGVLEKEGQEYRLTVRQKNRKQKPQKPLRLGPGELRRIATFLRAIPETRALLLRRVDLLSVDIRARIGLGDAAWTAVAAGLLRTALPMLLARLTRGAQVRTSVQADFKQNTFVVGAECIIGCYAGDVILITTNLLGLLIKSAFMGAGRTHGKATGMHST